jgi:hypothetical protein
MYHTNQKTLWVILNVLEGKKRPAEFEWGTPVFEKLIVLIFEGNLFSCHYQFLAHELGHNLGMPHDFIDPYADPKSIRYDSNGNSCTDLNGIMDYSAATERWTTCSVEKLTAYYNSIIARQGRFCMNNPGKLLKTMSNSTSVPLSVPSSVRLSVCSSVRLSVCPSARLFIRPTV